MGDSTTTGPVAAQRLAAPGDPHVAEVLGPDRRQPSWPPHPVHQTSKETTP